MSKGVEKKRRFPRRYLGGLFVLYSLLFAFFLSVEYPNLRPLPIFLRLENEPEEEFLDATGFSAGKPFEIEFVAAARNIDSIYWKDLIQSSRQNVIIRVVNLTQNFEIAQLGTPTGGLGVKTRSLSRFEGNNEKNDRIRIEITSLPTPAPRLYHTDLSIIENYVETTIDGATVDWTPLVYLGKRGKKSQPELEYTFFDLENNRMSTLHPSKGALYTEMREGEPVTIRFLATIDDSDFLYLPDMKPSPDANIRVRLVNESRKNTVIDEWSTAKQGSLTRTFAPANHTGDKIAVHFTWEPNPPFAMPEIGHSTTTKLVVRDGGKPFKAAPRFLLHYEWPTRNLFWIWLAVPLFFLWALHSEKDGWRTALFLGSLGIAAAMGSILAWEQNYAHFAMHSDPDAYGAYAETLANWVKFAKDRPELESWMRHYEHTHVALVPSLIALLLLATPLSQTACYIAISGLASFGALVAMFYHLRHQLALSRGVSHLMTALFAAHLMMHKAFARPSTDAVGNALIVFTFVALASRWKRVTVPNSLVLALLIFLHAIARPPGIAFAVPIFGLIVIGDYLRDRPKPYQLDLKRLGIIVFPFAALLLLYLAFGWSHNQQIALQKSITFRAWSTPVNFFQSLFVSVLGILPIIWLSLARKGSEKPRLLIVYVSWMLFYLVLIYLVKAPFLLRLFLPIVPAIILITAVSLQQLSPRWKTVCCWIIAGMIALNCAIIFYDISIPYLPPRVFAPFIY